jgi:hypothetical protein
MDGEDFEMGTGPKAKLDLSTLNPPQSPMELNSVIVHNNKTG